MKFLDVDFTKPWWDIILRQRFSLFIVSLITLIDTVYNSVFPILLAWSFETGNPINFTWVILIKFITNPNHEILKTLSKSLNT